MRMCPICLMQLSEGSEVCLTHKLPPDPLVGQVVGGRFQVGRRQRLDDAGAEYVGAEVGTGRRVVVEVRPGDLGVARAMTRLRHKNLLRVHHAQLDHGGRLCVIREWQDGETLADRLRQVSAVELLSGGRIALQLGQALQVMHDAGLAHGALNGKAVLLLTRGDRDDYVKLGGFRMAPGGEPAQDVRRLAALIYHLLCGTPPVRPLIGARDHRPQMSAEAEAVMMQALVAAPDSGQVPGPLHFGTAMARALLDSTGAVRAIADEDVPPTPTPRVTE